MHIMGSAEREKREKGLEGLFEEIMAKNFPRESIYTWIYTSKKLKNSKG